MPPLPLSNAASLNVPQTLAQAFDLHKQGRLADAERLYAAILAARPDHFDALHHLALIRLANGQAAEALQLIASAMRARAPSPLILLNQGLAFNALNRPQDALDSFDRAIALKSKFVEAHNNRGVVLTTLGRNEEALESFRKALAITPSYVDAISNRGNALINLKRFDEALKCYDRALALRPQHVESLYNRGNALGELGRRDEAVASYDRALALRPDLPEAHCNRASVLHDLRRYSEALASAERAVALRPNYIEAHFNHGNILYDLKRFDEAVASYDRTLALLPSLPDAWSNRGNTLRELNRFDEALTSYERAIALRPTFAEALSNRGMILHDLGRLDEALVDYDRALAARPDYVDALNNRAETLRELKRFEEALVSYERLMVLRPDHPHAFSGAAACAINLCDWEQRTLLATQMASHVTGNRSMVSSFVLIGYSDDPALHLQCARNHVGYKFAALPPPLWTGETWRHDRLRVAYLSADFRAHATSFLMAGLFEQHDRSRFEISAYSFGADEQSATRQRLVAGFDQFHEVRSRSDREVALMLREAEIDIAVDLKGYTHESRPGILTYRPAPVAVNYLGYPGSMGAEFIDYILADRIVAPFEHQPYFAEKIVHLPGSYQVNDSKRIVAEQGPTRQQAGLPGRGFVFCSFNNNWKITPDVFDVWMRLLKDVEGSVLWLLRDTDGAERNLRQETQRRGVDPARLIFAERLAPPEHLARHRLADLFLDTLPCNAHTTASDALWAGLPLLTCLGGAFAGRVAASLLDAAGVPELIAPSLNDYHALALTLAREPDRLAAIKSRLAQNRGSCALFDTMRFARDIESAYMTMWETWQRGEAPKSFAVAPSG